MTQIPAPSPPQQVICANPDCQVAQSGQCVEAHAEPKDCPHFGRTASAPVAEVPPATAPHLGETTAQDRALNEKPRIQVATGEALEPHSTLAITAARPTRTVAMVGPVDAGKTSLIAGLFDLFADGSVGELSFAGSSTLIGFERICHPARAVSEASEVLNDRTPSEHHPRFYHLCISNSDGLHDILVTDRSGENYDSVADQPSLARQHLELHSAQILNLIIDGADMCNPQKRHAAETKIQEYLAALHQVGLLHKGLSLVVLLTKLDLVEQSDRKSKVLERFDGIVSSLQDRYLDVVANVLNFRVAASPQNHTLPRGHGVAELLEAWLDQPAARESIFIPMPPSPVRAMARHTPTWRKP